MNKVVTVLYVVCCHYVPIKQLHMIKLQPAIFPLSKHVIRFHELPAEAMQCILQWAFIVDWI